MQISVKIATLDGIFVEKEVYMAILPAFDGDVGIMASHLPFIFKLGNGLIQLYDNATKSKEKIFIYGGFSQVHKNKVDIVTDKVVKLEELRARDSKDRIVDLENQFANIKDEILLDDIRTKLKLHRKILEVIQFHRSNVVEKD